MEVVYFVCLLTIDSNTAADELMPPARRSEIEEALLDTGLAYTVTLYGGTQHGFGVRANVSDPIQKFGKEQAFYQAVTWFETWA